MIHLYMVLVILEFLSGLDFLNVLQYFYNSLFSYDFEGTALHRKLQGGIFMNFKFKVAPSVWLRTLSNGMCPSPTLPFKIEGGGFDVFTMLKNTTIYLWFM